MRSINTFPKIYLHVDAVDFRNSIGGLSSLVQAGLELDPFESALFVFCCKNRKRIKILYWDKTGFALWYKKLERDRFPWPKSNEAKAVIIAPEHLEWLLSGIDIWNIKPHQEKSYSNVC